MNTADYRFKTELHAHTNPASPCGNCTPEEVIKCYADTGYDSIVISNHFCPEMRHLDDKEKCIAEYLKDFEAAKTAGEQCGLNVIFGCELRFTENCNDYLIFGIDPDFVSLAFDSMPNGLESFSKVFRDDDTMIVHAHPYRDGMTEMPADLLDGVEVFNMRPESNSRIAFAAKYAQKHNLTVTCGTDFHYEGHQGMTALLTKTEIKTSRDIVKVLKSRDYLIEIGGCIVLPYGEF